MDPHHVRPVSRRRNWSTITVIVITNAFGNLLLAIGTRNLPEFSLPGVITYLAVLFTDPWILSGIFLLAIWMFAQLTMLSWSDLSYVIPVTASGYVITGLLSVFILHESISLRAWAGIALISLGVLLVAETAPKTPHIGDVL
jgi:uncharacterized membrane protein